jgi:hypothetical protein
VIVEVPVAMPVTIPVVNPTVATAGILLLQCPPPGVEVSVIVAPTHKADGPPIAPGAGLAVTVTLPLIGPLQPVVLLVPLTV